eukprot:CAMPEP_0170850306 /NCGR_PEP_ID=MMETSP0734-20130129/10532_1 /TAXON_ID=186038 /ORGANISM="Fragilariopsis kerguelensis, Strain L26-C5" /LENGTH=32 /DNA_ID= /DNA_START= /DNA_END= /DNA_ORIENTATION=
MTTYTPTITTSVIMSTSIIVFFFFSHDMNWYQ